MRPALRTLILKHQSLRPYGGHPNHDTIAGIRYCKQGCWDLFLRHRDRIAALPPIRRPEHS